MNGRETIDDRPCMFGLHTYGMLYVFSFGVFIQSFCHYVSWIAHLLCEWTLGGLAHNSSSNKPYQSSFLITLPHRCKSFVENLHQLHIFLPCRGKTSKDELLHTYGMLDIISYVIFLQSFCHYVARTSVCLYFSRVVNRFCNCTFNAFTQTSSSNNLNHLSFLNNLPLRGKSFVAILHPTYIPLPHWGKTLTHIYCHA